MASTIEGLGGAPPPVMIAENGEAVVASGALVPRGRVAGLERAARLAGEAFGHEEPAPLNRLSLAATAPSRWLIWLSAGFAALFGRRTLSAR